MDDQAPAWADFVAGWELGVYRDPVLAALVSGLALGALGVFIVLRRAVFVTVTMSQAAGLGVALAFYVETRLGLAVSPLAGAFVAALLVAVGLALASERARLPREAVLGAAFVGCSALAVIVGNRLSAESHDLSSILFGSAVVVTPEDLRTVTLVAGVVLAALVVGFRGFLFAGFDRESARVQGLPVRLLELALWGLVTLAVAATTGALGALPVFALVVLPALGALAVARRVGNAVLLATLLGGASGALGYVAAFFGEAPVGPSQAVTAGAFALLLLAVGGLRRA